MKKYIKLTTIFLSFLVAFSCQKPYEIYDESSVSKTVYVGIDNVPTSQLFYSGQPASSYKTKILTHGTVEIDKMETFAITKDNSNKDVLTLVKTTTFPTSIFEVTLQEVATALGRDFNTFQPGDQVLLSNKIIAKNGQVFSSKNTSNLSGGLLTGAAYKNLLNNISVFVTCPFNADEAAGTYTVVRDDWEDVFPGDNLEVVKIDATTIDIVQYPATNNPVPLRVKVDPTSGAATVTKQLNGKYTFDLFTAGTGFVFSCAGYVTLTLNFTYNGGAYNGYTIIIQK
jgi:hypothetical protein